jgi:AcrR family transcriptional regulator
MGRRSDHTREELKELALGAARRIVAKRGYRALSARNVSAAIGYTVGSLYLVFENLEDLVLHVNGATMRDLHSALETVAAKHGHPETRILAIAREYIGFAFGNRLLWALIFEHPMPKKTPAWYSEQVSTLFSMVEAPLALTAPARSPAEIQLATHALWSGVHGVSVLGVSGRLREIGLSEAQKTAASLVSNYLIGFKQQQARRSIKK